MASSWFSAAATLREISFVRFTGINQNEGFVWGFNNITMSEKEKDLCSICLEREKRTGKLLKLLCGGSVRVKLYLGFELRE
jgi:hypothetical protein